jgi:hypothetical protein
MPFEPGHKHSAKSKLFDGALRRAIAQADGDKLREAADALLNAAADGKPWAIALLADRLDGKADQTVHVSKNVESMSLAELAAEVADLRAGDKAQAGGADGPGAVH